MLIEMSSSSNIHIRLLSFDFTIYEYFSVLPFPWENIKMSQKLITYPKNLRMPLVGQILLLIDQSIFCYCRS